MKLVSVESPKPVETAAPAKKKSSPPKGWLHKPGMGYMPKKAPPGVNHDDWAFAKTFEEMLSHADMTWGGPEGTLYVKSKEGYWFNDGWDPEAGKKISKKPAGAKIVTKAEAKIYRAKIEAEEASVPAKEEAKGVVRKLLDKAKRKIKGLKDTGHPLGNDLQDMMAQYAALKKAGKGDSKKAKALGEQIGKIKNSLRGKKKEEASVEEAAVDKKALADINTALKKAGFETAIEDTHVRFFNRSIPNTKGKPWQTAAQQLSKSVDITNFDGKVKTYQIMSCKANDQSFYVAFDEDGVGAASNDKNYVG